MPFVQSINPTFVPGRMIGSKVVYFEDFVTGLTLNGHKFSVTANAGDWNVTQDASATEWNVADEYPGGVVTASVGAVTNGERNEAQLNGTSFSSFKRELYFEVRAKTSAITAYLLFGLGSADNTMLASPASNIIAIGTQSTGTGVVQCIQKNAGTTSTATASSIVADTFHTFAFHVSGNGQVHYFLDGTRVSSTDVPANVPSTTAISPFMGVGSTGNVDEDIFVDYVYVTCDRD